MHRMNMPFQYVSCRNITLVLWLDCSGLEMHNWSSLETYMRNIKISKDWIILFATCDYIIDIGFDFFCGFVFWVFLIHQSKRNWKNYLLIFLEQTKEMVTVSNLYLTWWGRKAYYSHSSLGIKYNNFLDWLLFHSVEILLKRKIKKCNIFAHISRGLDKRQFNYGIA